MIKNCMYFCEGPCDEVLIKALKEEPGFIAPGKTSKGGSNNVDPNGFVVKTARNIGISFGD